MRVGAVVFRILFVGYFLYGEIQSGWSAYKETYVNPKLPPIYGLYDVEKFARNGQELPPPDHGHGALEKGDRPVLWLLQHPVDG
jgi:hypothetical protein